MSDYVDENTQLTPLLDLDSIDWAALNEEIMNEPWLDDFDWTGYYDQGAGAVPGIGITTIKITPLADMESCHQSLPDHEHLNATRFSCDYEGCKSKPFKHHGDLQRHKLVHAKTKKWYSCMAVDCPRKGEKGFLRPDKLKDHMLAAHDNDALFTCPDEHRRGKCGGMVYTKDLISIHVQEIYVGTSDELRRLNWYRNCPLPRCSYRVFVLKEHGSLDPLQKHLLDQHDAKGRANFAGRIRERGYDPRTAEIICPICPGEVRLLDHSMFYHHLFEAHSQGLFPGINTNDTIPAQAWFMDSAHIALRSCTVVPDEIHRCRRAILSLWPMFEDYPVWDDILHQ